MAKVLRVVRGARCACGGGGEAAGWLCEGTAEAFAQAYLELVQRWDSDYDSDSDSDNISVLASMFRK